jgi:anti-sigma28 factor (negative regulator of flagellin synthesis)
MTTENTGSDPVAVLYDRFTQDIFNLQASLRCDRMVNPFSPDELEADTKECWVLFESYLATYHSAFERLNESLRLHRELLQVQELNKLVFRTRAKQSKQPYIIDAKAYIEKARLLYWRWIEELTPVEGKRTVKAFLAKVDHCQSLWVEYGFANEEIERLPALLDNLQNEWALIEVDREPSYKATLPTPTQDDQAKVAEPTKPRKKWGRSKADWTQEDKKIIELSRQGMKPQEIASKLGLPNLVTKKKIRALKRRIKDGNPPK